MTPCTLLYLPLASQVLNLLLEVQDTWGANFFSTKNARKFILAPKENSLAKILGAQGKVSDPGIKKKNSKYISSITKVRQQRSYIQETWDGRKSRIVGAKERSHSYYLGLALWRYRRGGWGRGPGCCPHCRALQSLKLPMNQKSVN